MRKSLFENWEQRNGLLLPKGYLSSSQCDLFETNPKEYRLRYYEGKPSPSTVETRFGSEVHDKIENNHPDVVFVPRYDEHEHCIQVYVEGIPVLAYLDGLSFVDADAHYTDYKTGVNPWTDSKVRAHKQLVFYAMVLQAKYGTVRHMSSITWIETQRRYHNSLTQQLKTYDLSLTGEHVVYNREVEQWEIDRQKERLVRVAHEISTDYKNCLSMI
jgi:hypothetical protein